MLRTLLAKSPTLTPLRVPAILDIIQLNVDPAIEEFSVTWVFTLRPLQTGLTVVERMGLRTTITGNGAAAGERQVPFELTTVTLPLNELICTVIALAVTGSDVIVAPGGKVQL